jgi:ABC-type branched-subunit amino acid transport system substrate-binding protein
MTKARTGSVWKAIAIFTAGAVFGILAAYQVVPASKAENVATGPGDANTTGSTTTTGGPGGSTTGPGGTTNATTTGTTGGVTTGTASGLQCSRTRNGGATDKGVTATSINMATTVVRSGIGAAFLGEVQYAMDALRIKQNRLGGICGRQLNIKYVDDAWSKPTGERDIRNFVDQGYFAIPIGPSSEGLNAAIRTGVIREAGIPVVGTDGMVISQYQDPWVWPVAVSTASSARIMAQQAHVM